MSYRYGEDDVVTRKTDDLIMKYGSKLSDEEKDMIKSWKTLGACREEHERVHKCLDYLKEHNLGELDADKIPEEDMTEICFTHTPSVFAREAAILLGVTKETVRRWGHERKIKYNTDTMNMFYYDLEDILKIVDNNRAEKSTDEYEEQLKLEDI